MKKIAYNIINRLGYGIYNKKKIKLHLKEKYKKFAVKENLDLLIRSAEFVDALDLQLENFFIKDHFRGLEVSFLNFVFVVESREEFLIMKEIFVDQDYGFKSVKDSILLDIGANVGMTSIYFSQFENIKKIFAFEPVKDTFEIAVKNFELNNIAQELFYYNFGLGSKNSEEEFIYNRWVKGNAGIRGKLSPSYNRKGNFQFRSVIIKDASEILFPIIHNNLAFQVIVKMDCEGAEYEIMENLHISGALKEINILMIEWHDHGSNRIEEILMANNYIVFSRNLTAISGMIYAVKV